jgi:tetratricopeptide (TPR) repeat protein
MGLRQLQRVRVELLVLLSVLAVWLARTLVELDTARAQINFIERCAAIVASNPDDPHAHFALAQAYRRKGNLEAAIQSYEEAVRLAPDRLNTYGPLADCYQKLNRPDDVMATWSRGLQRDPDWAWRRFHLVGDYVGAGDTEEQIARWREIAELRSDAGWPYVFLAEAHESLQQDDDAQACYRKAGQADPDLAEWLLRRGEERRQRGDWNEAVTFYMRSLKVQPAYPPAHFELGKAYLAMDETDSALQAYGVLRGEDERLAKKLLDQIRARYEDRLDVHEKLARIHLELRAYEEAATAYRDILAIEPKRVAAHVGLGEALSNVGRYDDAVRSYGKAILMEPDTARTHLLLGRTYVAQEHHGLAIDSLKRALKLDPEAPDTHYELGKFYLRVKNQALAVRHYRRLKELDATLAGELRGQIQEAAEQPARAREAEAELDTFGRLKTIGFDQNGKYIAYFERLDSPVRHGETVFGFDAQVSENEVKFSKNGMTWVRKLSE